MSFSLIATVADAADIEEIAQQIDAQQSGLETTALILGLILLTVMILITWQVVRWVDRKGLGVRPMIAAGVLTPVVIWVSLFSLTVGPVEMLNSFVSGRTQPILVSSGFFLIGPLVTWVAIRRRKQRLQQSFEAFK